MTNIQALVGSNNENSFTYSMVSDALEIASQRSNFFHEITKAADRKILYCRGCDQCFRTGICPLDQEDDIGNIKDSLEKADLILFASPVYANHVPGILKSVIDRLSHWNHLLKLRGKKGITIAVSSAGDCSMVLWYLNSIMTAMGVNVLYSSQYKKENMQGDKFDRNVYINTLSENIIKAVDNTGIQSNVALEQHFQMCRQQIEKRIAKDIQTHEVRYWVEHGMISSTSLSELLMKHQLKL